MQIRKKVTGGVTRVRFPGLIERKAGWLGKGTSDGVTRADGSQTKGG